MSAYDYDNDKLVLVVTKYRNHTHRIVATAEEAGERVRQTAAAANFGTDGISVEVLPISGVSERVPKVAPFGREPSGPKRRGR